VTPPPPDGPYQVRYPGKIGLAIRELNRQANRNGQGKAFIASLKQIVHRMESDPARLGEPLYRLPVLRMQVRCVALLPVMVYFAVCEDHAEVIIMNIRLM
jgi:hypothetical protein